MAFFGKKPKRKQNPWIRGREIVVIDNVAQLKPRKPIGEAKKQRVQWEAKQATTLEGTPNRLGLFQLHGVDFVHFETVRTSRGTLKAGFPDYFLIGDSWCGYLEIKARNQETNAPGKLSMEQRVFHDKLRAAGCDVMTALLPDDLATVNSWLEAKTGRRVNIDGLVAS